MRSLLEVLDDPVGVVLDVGVHAGQVAGAAVRRSEADDPAEDVRCLVAVEMHQRAAAVRRARVLPVDAAGAHLAGAQLNAARVVLVLALLPRDDRQLQLQLDRALRVAESAVD